PSHGLPRPVSALRTFVFDVLAALDEPGPRTLARLLSSPYVDVLLRPSERARRARVVRALRRAPRSDEGVAASLRPLSEEEAAAVRHLHELVTRFPSVGTMSELCAASRALFLALGVEALAGRADLGAFSADEASPSARLEREAVARDARAWAEIAEALDSLEAASRRLQTAHVVLPRARFVEELAALAPRSSALPGASRAFALRVGEPSELAGEELSLLILADVSGRLAAEPRSPLVNGDILRALGAGGAGGAGGAEESKAVAALALAASRAERVVLTVAATEDDAPVDVAPFVSRLLRAGVAQSTWGAGSRLERALSRGDYRVAVALAGAPPDLAIAERVDVERAREGFFLDERRPLSAWVGALTPTEAFSRVVAEETGGEPGRPLPVTGLERLAECPFRGFAHVVLGARDAPEDADVPTPREEGATLHEALAVALTAARDLLHAEPRSPADILAAGLAAARDHLAREPESAVAALRGVLELHVLHRVEAVLHEAIADDEWDFEVAEQSFGEPGRTSWPELAVGDDLAVRGRVDRVDRGRGSAAARVVDYKRGAVDETVRRLGSTALQVPLYALAAQRAMGVPMVKGLYLSLRDLERGGATRRRGEEAVDRALADGVAVGSALAAVRRLRAGDLAPRPLLDTQCRTCPFAGGCRRPRFAMPPEEDLVSGPHEGGG
ncbi:MAG TPA: PD-(D/E)XK nuclease family protein, partial [Polyangiaceae bacterium]|nr:PD-(D/E)XK nuclease family protein [Polyangiaceae bacterium]